jgi:flavin reductase (DIM6/NTAB) family NADH-FMN oxidoreductase RutF
MSVDPAIFKAVMSRFATGVTVVTSAYQDQRHGLTVSSFSSVSLNPPLVLVCIENSLYSRELIEKSGVFAVNILKADQRDWGMRFAGMIPGIEDRFADIDCKTAVTGSPILVDCLAWVDCRIYQQYDGGDHTIFVGEVVAGEAQQGHIDPLLYYSRAWRFLTDPES